MGRRVLDSMTLSGPTVHVAQRGWMPRKCLLAAFSASAGEKAISARLELGLPHPYLAYPQRLRENHSQRLVDQNARKGFVFLDQLRLIGEGFYDESFLREASSGS